VTAKGGDLLNRTVENYNRPLSREVVTLENGQERDSDESEEEEKTPKEDKMDVDEPGSVGGRVTRGRFSRLPFQRLFHFAGRVYSYPHFLFCKQPRKLT
jgi:chromatin structure-remodeling complex subunit RSC9